MQFDDMLAAVDTLTPEQVDALIDVLKLRQAKKSIKRATLPDHTRALYEALAEALRENAMPILPPYTTWCRRRRLNRDILDQVYHQTVTFLLETLGWTPDKTKNLVAVVKRAARIIAIWYGHLLQHTAVSPSAHPDRIYLLWRYLPAAIAEQLPGYQSSLVRHVLLGKLELSTV